MAYFLSMSLAPGLRSALERPLLGHYAAALRTAGVAVDEAELWEEYRCGAAYSLALAVSLNASAGAAAGEAPGGGAHPRRRALAAAVAARVAAALVETGAEALLR